MTDTLDFLGALFGDLEDDHHVGVVAASTKGWGVRAMSAGDLDAASALIDQLDNDPRCRAAYVNTCALAGQPVAGSRGTAADISAIVAVWADVDVDGPGHAGSTVGGLPLAPTRTLVRAVLDETGLAPSIVIDSGGGLQAWWLLDAPWTLDSEAEHASGDLFVHRWGRWVQQAGVELGVGVDNVGDLPRVLRPPGTTNRKTDPQPVHVTEWHPERRYSVGDVEDTIGDLPAERPPAAPATPRKLPSSGYGPADAVSEMLSWSDVLEPHGWTYVGASSTPCSACGQRREYWARPGIPLDHHGRPDHLSASACHALRVHSSNDAATGLSFKSSGGYSKWAVFVALNYGPTKQDECDAARAIRRAANARKHAAA